MFYCNVNGFFQDILPYFISCNSSSEILQHLNRKNISSKILGLKELYDRTEVNRSTILPSKYRKSCEHFLGFAYISVKAYGFLYGVMLIVSNGYISFLFFTFFCKVPNINWVYLENNDLRINNCNVLTSKIKYCFQFVCFSLY